MESIFIVGLFPSIVKALALWPLFSCPSFSPDAEGRWDLPSSERPHPLSPISGLLLGSKRLGDFEGE